MAAYEDKRKTAHHLRYASCDNKRSFLVMHRLHERKWITRYLVPWYKYLVLGLTATVRRTNRRSAALHTLPVTSSRL